MRDHHGSGGVYHCQGTEALSVYRCGGSRSCGAESFGVVGLTEFGCSLLSRLLLLSLMRAIRRLNLVVCKLIANEHVMLIERMLLSPLLLKEYNFIRQKRLKPRILRHDYT